MSSETFLYHPIEAPSGKKFQAVNPFLEKLVHEGWVDDPAKIGVNIWDADNSSLSEYIAGVSDLFLSGYTPNIGRKGGEHEESNKSTLGHARCAIWGTYARSCEEQGDRKYIDSPRAGGKYFISRRAEIFLQRSPTYDVQMKARLTSWLLDQRLQGIECPLVNGQCLEDAMSLQPLAVEERATRFLKFARNQAPDLGDYVALWDPNVTCLAIAWSESVDMKGVLYLANELTKEGFLEEGRLPNGGTKYLVTAQGHTRITELEKSASVSRQVFVALWLDDDTWDAWENGLLPGIQDAGYEAYRIDLRDDVNKIDEDIIREIRKSGFVVADLTHGKEGARGSVFYEAGFAHALDLKVIFTCRKDLQDKMPFDTRQFHHIFWKTPEELRKTLTKRIVAWIGKHSLASTH